MLHSILIIASVLVFDMLHIKDSACAAFQGQKHSGITAKIGGIYMYHTAAFYSWLFPFD